MHFTYRKSDGDHLQQGDILKKTDELNKALGEIHPHYQKDDYVWFIVLTQSCDLVRRKRDKCSSPYITIAAVRPLSVALGREANKYRNSLLRAADANSRINRTQLKQFLERLLNNNEPEYFYLHQENSVGLVDRYCSFLRLSIAIKSDIHYEKCLTARVVSLSSTFQAKLGWLVGNMYSRVGTEDWVPDNASEADWREILETVLDDSFRWLDELKVREAAKKIRKNGLKIEDMDVESVRKEIENIEIKSRKEKIIDASLDVFRKFIQDFFGDAVDSAGGVDEQKLRNRLTNDPDFSSLTK